MPEVFDLRRLNKAIRLLESARTILSDNRYSSRTLTETILEFFEDRVERGGGTFDVLYDRDEHGGFGEGVGMYFYDDSCSSYEYLGQRGSRPALNTSLSEPEYVERYTLEDAQLVLAILRAASTKGQA